MSALTDFFFKSKPAVVRLQCLEIHHPNFSQTYRFVRNAVGGIYVYHEDSVVPQFYSHIPMKLEEIGSKNNLDQELEVTIGDVGSILPAELDNIRTANNMQVKPTLTYREYTSDDYAMEDVGGGEWVFDGLDDNITFGNVLDFDRLDPFTVSFWVETSDTETRLIGKRTATGNTPGWSVAINAGVLRYFLINHGSSNLIRVQSAVSVSDGIRHHVAISYDGSSAAAGVSIQVDGVAVGTTVDDDTLTLSASNNGPLLVGSTSSGSFLAGKIEHVAVWSQELSGAQMTSAYGGGTPPTDLTTAVGVTPLFWVKLDENDTATSNGIIDYGSGGNDGTAQGGLSPTGGVFQPVYLEPAFGPFNLQINSIAFNKQGCTFTAKPVQFNKSRTGDIYTVERFPMLKGFL